MKAFQRAWLRVFFAVIALAGCAKEGGQTVGSSDLPAAQLHSGSDTYAPNRSPGSVVGAPVSKGSVTVSPGQWIQIDNLGMVRFEDPFSSKEFFVDLGTYDQDADFGPNGSMTLMARTINYPLSGGAYPVLTSFYVVTSGGTIEFVKLQGCATNGMWVCSGNSCTANPLCTVGSGSSFASRQDWDQHQIPAYGFVTTNSFPRCDPNLAGSNCSLPERLPTGHYYAKYVLLSNSGGSVSGQTAGVQVGVGIKKDTLPRNTGTINGGINLNLIIVGDKNISDSHSPAGARNLDLLLAELSRLLKVESGAKIGLQNIKIYEWSDVNGGSQYSQVNLDRLGDLFESGSKGLDASDSGEFVNLFLVSDILYSSAYTILGLSGGILGPVVNGTQSSGVAVATGDLLATYNPLCANQASCPRGSQENNFLELANTVAHELGHYLGLNHPSEQPDSLGRQDHDGLTDTPECTARTVASVNYTLDNRACYTDPQVHAFPLGVRTCKASCDSYTGGIPYLSGSFSTTPQSYCPLAAECQFNHIMWWTTKHRKKEGGVWVEDGNIISQQSSSILQQSTFVR